MDDSPITPGDPAPPLDLDALEADLDAIEAALVGLDVSPDAGSSA